VFDPIHYPSIEVERGDSLTNEMKTNPLPILSFRIAKKKIPLPNPD
jgi:hypothetical protein